RHVAFTVEYRHHAISDYAVAGFAEIIAIGAAFERFGDDTALAANGLCVRVDFSTHTHIKKKTEVNAFVRKLLADTREPVGVVIAQFYLGSCRHGFSIIVVHYLTYILPDRIVIFVGRIIAHSGVADAVHIA